jgi:hypothetical protein
MGRKEGLAGNRGAGVQVFSMALPGREGVRGGGRFNLVKTRENTDRGLRRRNVVVGMC